MLSNYFDEVFVINLKRRPDRLKLFVEEANRCNIQYKVFDAIDCKDVNLPAPIAVNLTHKKIYEYCIASSLNSVCILEDDVVFHDDFNTLIEDAMNKLPSDWNLFYMGGNYSGYGAHLNKITESIFSIENVYCIHAFAINRIIPNMLEVLNSEIYNVCFDVTIAKQIQPKYNSYTYYPILSWQRNGFSDLMDEDINRDRLNVENENVFKKLLSKPDQFLG